MGKYINKDENDINKRSDCKNRMGNPHHLCLYEPRRRMMPIFFEQEKETGEDKESNINESDKVKNEDSNRKIHGIE